MPIFALASVSLAVIGYDLIHLAQRWIAYVLIAALLIFSVAVLTKVALPPSQVNWEIFGPCRSLRSFLPRPPTRLRGRFMSLTIRATCRATWESARRFGGRILAASWAAPWTMMVGTWAAALYPSLEVATALRTAADSAIPGFGKPLLLCSLLGLLTITSLNFYGASLTLLSVMDSLKPSRPTIAKRIGTLMVSMAAANRTCAGIVGKFRRQVR